MEMGWSDCCIAASILYFLFFSLPEPVWILRWQAETPSSNNLLASISTKAGLFLMEFHNCCIVEDPVSRN